MAYRAVVPCDGVFFPLRNALDANYFSATWQGLRVEQDGRRLICGALRPGRSIGRDPIGF